MRTNGLVGVGLAVLALAIAGIVVAADDAETAPVLVDAPSVESTSTTEPTPTFVMGDVDAIAVEVSPRTGLADGEVVTLTVDGADGLPHDAIVLMCTGEVHDDTSAVAGCDTGSVTTPAGQVGPDVVEGDQEVTVSRFLRVGSRETYDCATEPAGCILVLGPYRLPATAVAIPLAFADLPVAEPEVTFGPTTGLTADQTVTVDARGLRPYAWYRVSQCAPAEPHLADVQPWSCDGQTLVGHAADADGTVHLTTPVHAAIYPPEGRVDCTDTTCALVVEQEDALRTAGATEITLAGDVVAPEPRLTLDPPGPYADGQEVTVRGTGFPPGRDLGGEIGQCPADRDTRYEERCVYDLDPVVVAEDGTLTLTRTLRASLHLTGSCADTGCVLGWVIPKGATVAPVPVEVT
ncbi:MAG TPA: neocarzinostatin apoprotein domain-containing protein [Iamia sp.]